MKLAITAGFRNLQEERELSNMQGLPSFNTCGYTAILYFLLPDVLERDGYKRNV
jgi:hypothetical protein